MNSKNLQDVLSVLRALVKSSRPAYRDYLGEKTQAEKVWQEQTRQDASGQTVIIGLISGGYEPKVGDILQVTVNGETGEYPLENAPRFTSVFSAETTLWFGSISYATLVSIFEADDPGAEMAKYVDIWYGVAFEDDNGIWGAYVSLGGKYVDGTVEISKVTTTVDCDIKKLPVECVPDETNKAISKAQTAAENAQTTADNAQTAADNAQTTANKPSDWAQTSSSASDYIKNKPFDSRFTSLLNISIDHETDGTSSAALSASACKNGKITTTKYPITGRIQLDYAIKTNDSTETVITSDNATLYCQGTTKATISNSDLNDGKAEFGAELYTLRYKTDDIDSTLSIEVCYENGKYVKALTYLAKFGAASKGKYKWDFNVLVPSSFQALDSLYLPLASESAPGAVLAPGKDDDYTQPVAADENGYLWAKADAETKSAVGALKDRLTTLEEKIAELTAADTESASEG